MVLRQYNLIFMGTPEFAAPSLKALIAAGHVVVAVYTAPPRPAGRGQKEVISPVHAYALSQNIPVFTPLSLKDETIQKQFREHHADAVIVAAYGLLLPKAILEATTFGCLNVHPSLLPRWRGAAPIQRAVMAGDKETGVVIMQMNAGLDTGDMLLTRRETIADGTTAGELHNTLASLAGPMLLETLEGLASKTITSVPQPNEGITYAAKITKAEAHIDWSEPAAVLRQKILGLNPHPGAFFIYKDEAIKIWDAAVILSHTSRPGLVIDNNLTIACGENALRLLQLQRPGKKSLAAAEWRKGFAIATGTVLE